ncbi:polysaccharide biosynthesis protein [Marinomonas ushuaiensis DSM 15871]|uniref:Polysaccharide biosynthesis protein n=2 Tax=Marinomonas TaxID=28253 RepID=X7E9G5_9GAMM|nr:polysaccharide biosynthesis protein [Marinomonas ushuaiensis DSM 15871]
MRERAINLLWLLIEQGGRVLSSLLITLLVVNHLGAEDFGVLSLSLAILTALGAIVGLGMDPILFKLFISKKKDGKELIETSCFLRLVVSVIVIISITLLNILSDELYIDILNVLVIGFLFDSFLSLKDYFGAHLKNKFYTYSTLVSLLTQLVLTYTFVENEVGVIYFSFTYLLAKIIQATSLYICYFNLKHKTILPRLNKKLATSLLRSSFPMMLAASIGLLYSLQDQFFIKYFLGEYELGLYAVGIKMILVLIVLPTLISNVFYPSLVSKFHQENSDAYIKQLESIYTVFFILGFVAFISMFFASEFIITTLFSDEFLSSVDVMKIYSLLLILTFFQSINNKILILHNLETIIFKRALLALSINAVLNYLLIPRYGINGAAYSTVISELFVLISYALIRETRFIFIYQVKAVLLVSLFKSDFIRNLKT